MTLEQEIQRELTSFTKKLSSLSVFCEVENFALRCGSPEKSFTIDFSPANVNTYHLFLQQQKLIALIKNKLGLNSKVFARKCTVRKIDNITGSEFLDRYHLMNSTLCAHSYGLFLDEEMLALATFSKGRKMNRLPEDKRSFELIRFCTREGITITGGLTRLLKHFCREKNAGDIMTYVDKQFSDGEAFSKAGFKKHSELPRNHFLFNQKTKNLIALKEKPAKYSPHEHLLQNAGSIKMIFSPDPA